MANSLATALLDIQGRVPELQRNALNPYHGNRYVTLDNVWSAIAPLLQEHQLIWTTSPCVHDGHPALRYKLTHAPSGDTIEDVMWLMLERISPQGQGSAVTYARRYALCAVLNLIVDQDDDGQSAEQAVKTALPSPTPTPAPQAPPTEEDQIQMRAVIAELSGQLAADFSEEWQKAIAWGKERGFDLASPPTDKLRVVERALRKKLDACNAKAKTSGAESKTAELEPGKAVSSGAESKAAPEAK